jgi:hypothetical protein
MWGGGGHSGKVFNRVMITSPHYQNINEFHGRTQAVSSLWRSGGFFWSLEFLLQSLRRNIFPFLIKMHGIYSLDFYVEKIKVQDVYLGVTPYSFYKNLIIFDQINLCFFCKCSAGT